MFICSFILLLAGGLGVIAFGWAYVAFADFFIAKNYTVGTTVKLFVLTYFLSCFAGSMIFINVLT